MYTDNKETSVVLGQGVGSGFAIALSHRYAKSRLALTMATVVPPSKAHCQSTLVGLPRAPVSDSSLLSLRSNWPPLKHLKERELVNRSAQKPRRVRFWESWGGSLCVYFDNILQLFTKSATRGSASGLVRRVPMQLSLPACAQLGHRDLTHSGRFGGRSAL
jgi:hypothetical protein